MKKKYLIFLSIILIFFEINSCGKIDKKTQEDFDNIKNELNIIKETYNQSLKNYRDVAKENFEDKININKKNILFLNIQLKKYLTIYIEFPKNEKDFIDFINTVPKEMFSYSNRISYINDKNGGWFIDIKKKKIIENIDLDLIKF